MNQEYARQTVKKLVWLSDWMISEIDSNSENYWNKHSKFIYERIGKILSLLGEAKLNKDLSLLTAELWVDPWLYRQHNLSNLIITDPFLPKQLREKISKFYGERVVVMSTIYTSVMIKLCSDLLKGKLKDVDSEIKSVAWIRLNESYQKKNWGWEKTHKKIESLRGEIEKYLINLK
ncbi:MAG: hypothetical protein QY309_15260 [Cyclobacteriaceae bacterium]|nr:MAG: hypothetical protein QY309_15260 [Cyclobacteriaceae bacterium]